MTESSGQRPRGERWGVLTDLVLKAAPAARRHIAIDEGIFRSHTFHTAPKAFFLWTALDEVCKAALFLLKLDSFYDSEETRATERDVSDPMDRLDEAMTLEELKLRGRRLCELLVQLALFGQHDEDALYLHFMLLSEFVSACRFNEDLREFHGASSAWVQATVDMTVRAIHAVEPEVPSGAAWYANYSAPVAPGRWKQVLSSERQRIVRAIPLMKPFELISLGSTYAEAFGAPSNTIHFRGGVDPVDHSRGSVVISEGKRLGVLALCALRRCHELLGSPEDGRLKQIGRVLESSQEAPHRFQLLNQRGVIAAGDFVVARGFLGRVMEERSSSYGNRSVRVVFLAERPIPTLAEDWFRVRDVSLLFSRETFVAQVVSLAGRPAETIDDEDLCSSVVSAWNNGWREDVRWRGV